MVWQFGFTANEGVTGDSYQGYVLTAQQDTYSLGQQIINPTVDKYGSHWVYTITSAATQQISGYFGGPSNPPPQAGQVEVYNYDTANGYALSTNSVMQSLFQGSETLDGFNGLGSESDSIVFNGAGDRNSGASYGQPQAFGGTNVVSPGPGSAGLLSVDPNTNAVDYLKIGEAANSTGQGLTASNLVQPYTSWNIVADGGYGTNAAPFDQYNGFGNTLVSQNASSGQIDFLSVQNGSLVGSTLAPGAYWNVHASGNFPQLANAEGPALVSQSAATGQIDLLTFDEPGNGALTASLLLDGGYWGVVGAGDATGDGSTDIITQDSAGQIDFLTAFNGAQLTGSALAAGGYWPVKGIADLDHNGHPWLVSQNAATGQVDLLKFQGGNLVASSLIQGSLPQLVSGSQVSTDFWFF